MAGPRKNHTRGFPGSLCHVSRRARGEAEENHGTPAAKAHILFQSTGPSFDGGLLADGGVGNPPLAKVLHGGSAPVHRPVQVPAPDLPERQQTVQSSGRDRVRKGPEIFVPRREQAHESSGEHWHAEGFGTLDTDNLSNMKGAFEYLKTRFDSVFIISHLDTIKDFMDYLLPVNVGDDGFSKVIYN